MLYQILKVYVGFILKFFIKDFKINGKEKIPSDKAVLFAAFHSNSFLDAIILDTSVDRPVWSLARGDVFKNKKVAKLLNKLYMMPIYRISEGRRNMVKNDITFEKSLEVFQEKGQVLIFSEGLCKNQISLLPLKKGTARMAFQSWSEGVDVEVIPVAINYNQFTRIGKKVVFNIGDAIRREEFSSYNKDGENIQAFNSLLKERLERIISRDFETDYPFNLLYRIGIVINAPVYLLVRAIARARTRDTVFFDSVYLALLIFILPLYWILLFTLVFYII